MRVNLKVFRIRKGLNQEQMAERLGMSRSHYAEIENGRKRCGEAFMRSLQEAFGIPDCEMWELVKQAGPDMEVRKDG